MKFSLDKYTVSLSQGTEVSVSFDEFFNYMFFLNAFSDELALAPEEVLDKAAKARETAKAQSEALAKRPPASPAARRAFWHELQTKSAKTPKSTKAANGNGTGSSPALSPQGTLQDKIVLVIQTHGPLHVNALMEHLPTERRQSVTDTLRKLRKKQILAMNEKGQYKMREQKPRIIEVNP